MLERIPEVIRPMLLEYRIRLENLLHSKLFGVYLYNSIALGAFEKDKSDIDFISVLTKELNGEEIRKLRMLHKRLKKKYEYASALEGMYIVIEDIGKVMPDIRPHIYCDHGKLHGYGCHNINYVTWHTLKYNGVCVDSPDIGEYVREITRENLAEAMNYNLNNYWRKKLDKKLIFLSDYMIEFSVLTLCRILYTLESGKIVSKCQAAAYELQRLPGDFRPIIREALRIRKSMPSESLYPSRIKRQKAVKEFIRYIIDYCNSKYQLPV